MVTFYGTTPEIVANLETMEIVILAHGIKTEWAENDYHGQIVPTLTVHASGNRTAEFLRYLPKQA